MNRRPDESAALRALRESLAEEGGGHPAEELLLEYADKRASLAGDVVESIDAHLAQCASCRDEVGVFGAMTIRPIRVTSAAEVRADRSVWERIVSALSGPVWRPALALAALVVLMVPTLRLIGQERSLLRDMVERHDDVAMTVNENRTFQPSQAGDDQTLNGMAAMKDERQAWSEDEARATTIAPTIPPAAPVPPAKGADRAPSPPPPPPASVHDDAAPSPASPLGGEDAVLAERHVLADRERESNSRNAFAAQAMRKHRAIASPPEAPTLDYVPGGHASIPAVNVENVMLQLTLVRAAEVAMEMRSGDAAVGGTRPIVIASTVSDVDVVVIAADGRRNARRVEVGAGWEGKTALSVEIPVDWLAAGANHVDVVDRDGRRLAEASFVVERR